MLTILNKSKLKDEVYIQFPGEKTPADLFGGTWSAMFENEGVFFRTPGGTALAFNGGVQNAANTAHNHNRGTMEITGTAQYGNGLSIRGYGGGAFYAVGTGNQDNHGGGASYGTGTYLQFTASRTWTGVTSTDGVADGRPKNRTFRVWKRTS